MSELSVLSEGREVSIDVVIKRLNSELKKYPESEQIERFFSAAPGLGGVTDGRTLASLSWGYGGRISVLVEADRNDPGFFHLLLASYGLVDDPLSAPGINYHMRVLAMAKVVSRQAAWAIAEKLSA